MKNLIVLLTIVGIATQFSFAESKKEVEKTSTSQAKDRWSDHVESLLTSESSPEAHPREAKRRRYCQADLKDSQKLEIKTALQAHRTNIAKLKAETREARNEYRRILKDPNSTFEQAEVAAEKWLQTSAALLAARNQARNHILYNITTSDQRVVLNKCMFRGRMQRPGKHHGKRHMMMLKKCKAMAAKASQESPTTEATPQKGDATEQEEPEADTDDTEAVEAEGTKAETITEDVEAEAKPESKVVTESETPVKTMVEYEK